MKAILFLITTVLFSAASRADVGQVFTFGEGNVEAGSISNSTKLTLMHNVLDDRYYSFECKKSGLFKKNHMVFKVVLKDSSDVLVQAEADVQDCKQELNSIYKVAFERKSHVVIALSEVANDKEIFSFTTTYSSALEVVK